MFQLTIVFGARDTSWSLLFKERATAEKAITSLIGGDNARIVDDFGQQYIVMSAPSGFMLEDLELSSAAKVELHIHGLKMQDQVVEAIKTDPKLTAVSRMIQSLQNAGPAASRLVMPLGAIPRA